MMNEEENQLEIYDGKVEGDIGSKLMQAFTFREENELIGNVNMPVIANLLELFSNVGSRQHPTICNLYGAIRTGKKTIANYFGHLMVIKQLFQRVVMRVISSTDSIKDIVKKEMDKTKEEGLPFFIFVFSNKHEIQLGEWMFGEREGVSAIVVTEKRVEVEGLLNLTWIQPMPFRT